MNKFWYHPNKNLYIYNYKMYPTILLIGMISFILISNYLTLTIGDTHYNNNNNCMIYDTLHKILPDLRNYHNVIDLFGLLGLISLFFFATESLVSELFAKFVIIMFIRAFTTLTTILPKDENCDTTLNFRSYLCGGCFDKIFSGHTSFILLLTLLYYRDHIIDIYALFGINLLNIFMILSTRAHYTVDVLLAIFVTTTIYSIKI